MSTDIHALRAAVSADLPWRGESGVRGTLRIGDDALVLDRADRASQRIAIPLDAIRRSSIETTLGVLPALLVWHIADGQEVRSRFEFAGGQEEGDDRSLDLGLADRVGPGLARDAAARLEGGLRALSGGLRGGKRAMRQVVEGVARQEEYRRWPAAIARAQEALQRRAPAAAAPKPDAPPPVPPPPSLVPERVDVPPGDARARFAWFTREVLAWIDACGARARELGVQGVPIIQRDYPLDSPVCRIVVAGEFSRGKSTLINALFGIHGEIALPTGMTPTTPLACAIRVPNIGETDGATISYRTARPPLQLSLDTFRASVRLADEGAARETTDEGVPLYLDEARRVEVRITGAYLPAGVEIEDTPGLNEQSHRSAAALAALGRADLVLFVLAADQLLGDLEQDVIGRTLLQGHHRNVLFLINFWDTIEDEAQRAILRQRVETVLTGAPNPLASLADTGHTTADAPPVFYISALQAARAQRQRKPAPEESGIPHLRASLRELLGPRSSALLLRARAARALRYVELLQESVARAAAASALGGRTADGPAARARQPRDAIAEATRLIEELPGAASAAVAPVLAEVRRGQQPGLGRVATMIARAATEDAPRDPALQEARRALAAEMRTLAGSCGQVAQEAVDLLLAQVRAAFLSRGLAAPLLSGHVEVVPPGIPEQVSVPDLWMLFDGVPGALHDACRAGAERLRQALLNDLSDQIGGASTPMGPTPPPVAEDDSARRRLAALRSLEEDLLRARAILERCLT